MKKLDYKKQHNINITLALGFFDSVHIGHKKLIGKMLKLSEELGTESAIFTFINSPFELLRKDVKEILTFDERCVLFEKLQIDNVIYAKMDETFMSQDKDVFLHTLIENYNVKGIVCGEDYTYGKKAVGNVETLREFCNQRGIKLIVDDLLKIEGEKVSSTSIREYISAGDVDKINFLMGDRYFIEGEVIHCAGRGRHLGFPTANIVISDNKMALKSAVYQTIVTVSGKRYKAITNVGERPTFNENAYIIESYLEDFDKDIYGEKIRVEFVKKLREIEFFDSKDKLIERLEKDKLTLKELTL
ncbi:MAG: riboflavin biosynthesis protein RibF [Clostridia bacterium]|nr:riboflavin biosynthesis protein RibF [Clostridia bacterium]MDY5264751.1 riboflavin biosynthesis protein RibF [Eubacteriales bacterium]